MNPTYYGRLDDLSFRLDRLTLVEGPVRDTAIPSHSGRRY